MTNVVAFQPPHKPKAPPSVRVIGPIAISDALVRKAISDLAVKQAFVDMGLEGFTPAEDLLLAILTQIPEEGPVVS